jgi:pimeloyl-ACP methyl ester carboxylesterase
MFRLKSKIAFALLTGALTLPALAAAQAPQAALLGGGSDDLAFSAVERRQLTEDVAEYFFKVRVGAGAFEEIGIHRVVRETAPNVPARTSKAVFLAHGDVWNFRGAFLTASASAALPDSQSLPVFLAENGVDVWGIDFRWTFVPQGTTDFSFMEDWGIETDARDLGIALGVARVTRALTGSGFGKIHLLGWSRGGQTGYAYLNTESQLPQGLRQVKGFIPADIFLKTDDEALRQAACDRVTGLAGAPPQSENGVLFQLLGVLANADPNGASPIPLFAGLTNRQAALFVGTLTFQIFQPVPFYHFVAGTFDANSLPNGLLYTDETAFFDFESLASPYEPNQVVIDGDAVVCDQTDVAFDDHLEDITVPVLYVGAGGGFGEFGVYTTTLLGSTDVTTLIVDKAPDAARIIDYGHAELFLANDAQALVWQPILDWIQAH